MQANGFDDLIPKFRGMAPFERDEKLKTLCATKKRQEERKLIARRTKREYDRIEKERKKRRDRVRASARAVLKQGDYLSVGNGSTARGTWRGIGDSEWMTDGYGTMVSPEDASRVVLARIFEDVIKKDDMFFADSDTLKGIPGMRAFFHRLHKGRNSSDREKRMLLRSGIGTFAKEIDGRSSGTNKGLDELLEIVRKEWKAYKDEHALDESRRDSLFSKRYESTSDYFFKQLAEGDGAQLQSSGVQPARNQLLSVQATPTDSKVTEADASPSRIEVATSDEEYEEEYYEVYEEETDAMSEAEADGTIPAAQAPAQTPPPVGDPLDEWFRIRLEEGGHVIVLRHDDGSSAVDRFLAASGRRDFPARHLLVEKVNSLIQARQNSQAVNASDA